METYIARRINLRGHFNNSTFWLYQFMIRNITIRIHDRGALLMIYLGLDPGTADFSP